MRVKGVSLQDRLMDRVTVSPEGCWLCSGTPNKGGYMRVGYRNERLLVHRAMWEVTHGPIPEGMVVMHQCDVPPCINPQHLTLGTDADNVMDAMIKGRSAVYRSGEKHPNCRLSAATVRAIRKAPRGYGTGRELSKKYGVAEATISHIRNRVRRREG